VLRRNTGGIKIFKGDGWILLFNFDHLTGSLDLKNNMENDV
jgi:hypothetical protein